MFNRRAFVHALAAAPMLVAGGCAAGGASRGERAMPTENDGRHDFDFFHGRWRIHNWRLDKRLAGSDKWHEFEAIGECWRTISNCNVDTYVAEKYWDGQRHEGMTVRVFNPETRLWALYWADSRRGVLEPPVLGRWEGDQAVFVGDDTFEGRPIRCRFLWRRIDDHTATWEQAFSADGEKTWETNWRMRHTRIA